MIRLLLFIFTISISANCLYAQKDFETIFGPDKKKQLLYEILAYGKGNFGTAIEHLHLDEQAKDIRLTQIDTLLAFKHQQFFGKNTYALYYHDEVILTIEKSRKTLDVTSKINEEIRYVFKLEDDDQLSKVKVYSKQEMIRAKMDAVNITYHLDGKKVMDVKKDNKFFLQLEEVYCMFKIN